jgi:hypothetical protein
LKTSAAEEAISILKQSPTKETLMFRMQINLCFLALGVLTCTATAEMEKEIEAIFKKAGGTTKRGVQIYYVDLSTAEIPVDDLVKRLPELEDLSQLNLNSTNVGDDGLKLISKKNSPA